VATTLHRCLRVEFGVEKEALMKRFASVLAGVALLAMPMAAAAAGHGGGGGHGGGFGGHAGFGGHGGIGGRGGLGGHGGGFGGHGGRGRYGGYGDAGLGFLGGLGLGYALDGDPWYYGFPDGDADWNAPYPCDPAGCDYDGPGPGVDNAPAPAACGEWVWRADQSRYAWISQTCDTSSSPASAGE
jgi:hypothetical protein